jgi:hypothetical protein
MPATEQPVYDKYDRSSTGIALTYLKIMICAVCLSSAAQAWGKPQPGSGWLQQSARGMKTVPTVTTKDGVGILYKDWRRIRPKLQR